MGGTWNRLDKAVLGSAGTSLECNGFTSKNFIRFEAYIKGDGSNGFNMRLEVGSGSYGSGNDYQFKALSNGTLSGGDETNNHIPTCSGSTYDNFVSGYITNISGQEKLFVIYSMDTENAEGTATAPRRRRQFGKWITTSGQIDRLKIHRTTGGNYQDGSWLTVWGSDDADSEAFGNVETGTRLEETDTRKIYRYDENKLNYEDVVYNTNTADDVTISGNTATKGSAGANWDRGFVRSTQSISPSTGGGEVKWTGSRVYSMAGLDKGTAWSGSGTTYPTVEYALYPTDVYESGTDVGATVSTSTDAHIYKITMDSAGLVKYYVDGTLVHTSTVTASGTYYFAAMPYDTSDFVTGEIALPTGGFVERGTAI